MYLFLKDCIICIIIKGNLMFVIITLVTDIE